MDHVDGTYSLEINLLVASAEHNLWVNKVHFYNNPLFLTTAIRNQISGCNTKPPELREFENRFNKMSLFNDKMNIYCYFRNAHPEFEALLESNPFIDLKYHRYYLMLGPKELERLNYDEVAIDFELCRREIVQQCQLRFVAGKAYPIKKIKKDLQEIYDNLGVPIKAKATQLSQYLNVVGTQKTQPDGSRVRMLLIK